MRNHLAFILLFTLTVSYGQQTENRKLSSFSGVKASEGIDVYLKKGEKESARIEVSGDITTKDVLTDISGSYLKIHLTDERHRNINVKVYVTYIRLEKLSASSAGRILSEGTLRANSLEISASSAGSVEAYIETDDLDVTASSAGDIELKGKAKTFEVNASSAGVVDAYDLEAEKVEADASSAGAIKLSVTKELLANASSGGGIRYRGNPDKSNTRSSSGGSVKKSN